MASSASAAERDGDAPARPDFSSTAGHGLARLGVVVHDEHAQAAEAGAPRRLGARRVGCRAGARPPAGAALASGRRTLKVAPRPSPGLAASTVPPCSSTRWRTMARPRPRPPCDRVLEASPWRKRSKTWGRNSGLMPGAGVGHHDHGLGVHAPQPHLHAAALGRELDRVRQQVPHHLLQAVGVARARCPPRVQARPRAGSPWPRPRAARCRGRPPPPRAGSTRLHAQAQLARDDPRDVEDVVDELVLRLRVAVDGLQGPGRGGLVEPARRAAGAAQPTMAFSGVRSSWERVARNSSFSRFAASASSRASCSRARSDTRFFSSSRRSEMSWKASDRAHHLARR